MKLSATAAGLAACLVLAAPAAADGLMPHHATYEMSIAQPEGVVLNEGDFIINATTDCNMWNMSSVMTLDFDMGGQNIFVASTMVAQEAYDGSSITYQTAVAGPQGGHEVSATGSHDDGEIVVTDAAGTRAVAIDDDVLLPTAATLEMVERLRDGETAFTIKTWAAQGAHDVTENKIEVLENEPDLDGLPDGDYLDGEVWVIRLTQGEGETASEAIMQVHESGVTSRLVVGVGPVLFEGKLIAFENFSYVDCD